MLWWWWNHDRQQLEKRTREMATTTPSTSDPSTMTLFNHKKPKLVLREGERFTNSEPEESAVAADEDGGGGGGWGANEVGAPAVDEGRGTGLTVRPLVACCRGHVLPFSISGLTEW
jgi:hypothetical protein